MTFRCPVKKECNVHNYIYNITVKFIKQKCMLSYYEKEGLYLLHFTEWNMLKGI